MYIIQLLFIQYDKSGYKNRYSRQGGETQNCRNYYYFCCEAKGSASYTIWCSQKPRYDFESRGAKKESGENPFYDYNSRISLLLFILKITGWLE